MQDLRWSNNSADRVQQQTAQGNNWLWERHKLQPEPAEPAFTQAATAWALKSSLMQPSAGMSYGSHHDGDLQQQYADYWSQQDDAVLSPYLPGYQEDQPRPDSSPAVSIEPVQSQHEGQSQCLGFSQLPEELEDDSLLMDCLDLPPALPRSNSAHDLGENVDPETLPDLETLQESFQLPLQLRFDMAGPQPSQQAPASHQPYFNNTAQEQQHQHPHDDRFMKSHGHQHHAQSVSGATASSGPRSTASDESPHPGQYAQQQLSHHQNLSPDLLQLSPSQPARLAQSQSLPLFDDFDGLTALQQQSAGNFDQGGDDKFWYPMQHDKVVEQDTAAALEGLDLTANAAPPLNMPRAMSSDLECLQDQELDDWQEQDQENAEQPGVDNMSTADVLATLACLSPQIKRKGKGGRQPAMDPRLDPNVDPKKAKRILANRLSAARSKMKQKSHVENLRRRIDVLSKQKSDMRASVAAAKSSCDSKASDNEELRAQVQALEEQCHRQAMMTARLAEERNTILGISAPYTMYAPYASAKLSTESRSKNLPPHSARSAKNASCQGRGGATSKKSRAAFNQKGFDAAVTGQVSARLDTSVTAPPLISWGSTGKRQPRHKA